MIPNGGEAFGGQVPQIVGLRRGPERAYPSVGERGPQKQDRDMGCMGAEGPSSFGITHLVLQRGLSVAPSPPPLKHRLNGTRSRPGDRVAARNTTRNSPIADRRIQTALQY